VHTLVVILLACLAGGLLSVLLAAIVAYTARPSWIGTLISFAVGALLGAVFLELIPHIFEKSADVHTSAMTILAGILAFFILEKLVLWRHSHEDPFEGRESGHSHAHGAAHGHDHGRSGLMITIGDTFHNFVDGTIIAAAFMADFNLGLITALAILAHEIPQEIGDFVILLHSGYTRRKALMLNVISSLATVVGALIAWFALQPLQQWVPSLLCLAAASMIYVAVADLIPGLHKRAELSATVQQVSLIALGVGVIALLHVLLGK
jgi:zinc and cadmium transporter